LEREVTTLAVAKLAATNREQALRDASFEKRLQIAMDVTQETLGVVVPWRAAERKILSWYRIRSDIAHGRPPSQLVNVPAVIFQAEEIAATLQQVKQALGLA